MKSDTIAAIATAPGRGGVGMIRISGSNLLPFAFALSGTTPRPRHATMANFLAADGSAIDSGLLLFFPDPYSFTGEDVLEVHGHGGQVVTQTLTGAELREIVGFSLKTGLSGRISPLEVSGLTARFRIVERDGKQAVEWLAFDVGGKPLDDAKAYRVALNSFLAGGGDGYKQLVKPDAKDSGVLVRDVLGDALGKAGTYAPDRASRLVEEK